VIANAIASDRRGHVDACRVRVSSSLAVEPHYKVCAEQQSIFGGTSLDIVLVSSLSRLELKTGL
jgi:hypothetical protein